MIHFIIYTLILTIIFHIVLNYILSLVQSAINVYMNHNSEYIIESLQHENDLLRQNIERLETIIKENNN